MNAKLRSDFIVEIFSISEFVAAKSQTRAVPPGVIESCSAFSGSNNDFLIIEFDLPDLRSSVNAFI